MVRPELNTDLYVHVHASWMRMLGLWYNPNHDCRSLKFWLHWLHTFWTLLSVFVFPCTGEFLYLYTNGDDLGKIAEGLYLFLTEVYAYVKVAIFWMRIPKVIELLEYMKCQEFKPIEKEHEDMVIVSIKDAQWILKAFASLGIFGIIVALLMPITEGFEVLPTNVVYPFFDVNKAPMYQIIYLQQIYYKPITVIVSVSMDTILASFVCSIIAQLNILIFNLENMDELVDRRLKRIKMADEKSYDIEISKFMRECIIHHNKILTYVNKIESTFSLSCAVQFMLSAIILCLVELQFLTTPDPLNHKLHMMWIFFYLCAMTVQVYIHCYYGNRLIDKSEDLRRAVFHMNWTGRSEGFKKFLKLLQLGSNRALTLTAGKIFYLSLDTFKNIMKVSYNAFALMRNMR